ncbi:MAG: hypothetical protein Q7V14_02740 [Coriobacteriia bacterium]|nr:hypothetical protein [Coriobacteriia bacterium]
MPDISGIPTWVWAVTGISVAVAGVGGYFVFRLLRYGVTRRSVRFMVPKMQTIDASRKSLGSVLCHLAQLSDDDLILFAGDPDAVDRVALAEVEQKMRLLRDELDSTPLPADAIVVAQALADAAHLIAQESGRIHDDMGFDAVLAALADIDLAQIADVAVSADLILKSACEEYRIEDAAVYGGGLYI